MATERRLRLVYGQVLWMLAITFVLSALEALSIEMFVTASLVGFLLCMELTAPAHARPTWRRRLWWAVLFGLLGFAVIIAWRILLTAPVDVTT
ncbi:hypothetical protein [Natronorubrum sulfidifaciens]|uniref:Uncharacterized protein n=1 Tax=Natronorubrum sulfidifaciens JCM 14089 TaxID=1230460 RepID=L9W198_9EURY|nr:hypothetical protein [Natronorubrum sulfidifaciens]ELY42078.1 hypothetical protein C495_16048 [Natronorubrum sulfidifaciens JCM 14089]